MDPEETPSLITTTYGQQRFWRLCIGQPALRGSHCARSAVATGRAVQRRPLRSSHGGRRRRQTRCRLRGYPPEAIIWVTRCLIAAGDQDPLWDYRQLTSRRKGGARTSVFNAVMLLAPSISFRRAAGKPRFRWAGEPPAAGNRASDTGRAQPAAICRDVIACCVTAG